MAVGLSVVNYANVILNYIHRAVAGTVPAGQFIKLHTSAGDPGSAGANNASSVTTRPSATFSAAASGAVALSNTPTWASWAGTNGEVVRYISDWDAATVGTFLASAQLTADKTMNTGDSLTLSTFGVSFAPLAA